MTQKRLKMALLKPRFSTRTLMVFVGLVAIVLHGVETSRRWDAPLTG